MATDDNEAPAPQGPVPAGHAPVAAKVDSDGVPLPSISTWQPNTQFHQLTHDYYDPSAEPVQSPFGGYYTPSQLAHHPEAAEILRQMEFYFSDVNLRQDAHLLALISLNQNGEVRLSEMLRWPKMKKYKMPSLVKKTLRESHFLEVSADGKTIKRKYPLDVEITVTPQLNENRLLMMPANYNRRNAQGITKGMLKPTGFEDNQPIGPVSPEQYEKDLSIYDPADSIMRRVENAIAVFEINRTMHQDVRKVWDGLLQLSGFESNKTQFKNGVEEERKRLIEEEPDFSKEDIAVATAHYSIKVPVNDAIYDEIEGLGKSVWVVDFPSVTKAYLSTVFLWEFVWYDEENVRKATQVLRNFYSFLLTHSVCPEYNDQLIEAKKVCELAAHELPILANADQRLPGDFNAACSTLCKGAYAASYRSNEADWATSKDDNMGLSYKDADTIYKATTAAYGLSDAVKVIASEKVGLEVVSVKPPSEDTMKTYTSIREHSEKYKNLIQPMGKLICRRWVIPSAPPQDLPKSKSKVNKLETFEFFVEEETLKYCVERVKMEAVVKELEGGVKFIDGIERMWPTFYTYLSNERILAWKEPGDPKTWMKRQALKRKGLLGDGDPLPQDGGQEGEDGNFSDEEGMND